MNELNKNSPAKWFGIVAVIALIWNLLGLIAFAMQMIMISSDEAMSSLPEAQQELFRSMPMWVKIAFAVAVIAGVIGCIGLLIKKRWAFPVLILSLLGVLVQMGHMFFMTNTLEVMGPSSAIMPVLVLIGSILLVVLARTATTRGWLN